MQQRKRRKREPAAAAAQQFVNDGSFLASIMQLSAAAAASGAAAMATDAAAAAAAGGGGAQGGEAPAQPLPFDVSRVVAPMVGGSSLCFRLLCRRHGATLACTQMLEADRVVSDEGYRSSMMEPHAEDRPLVAQLCGSNAATVAAAAALLEPHVDCVDLNLGCPQERAVQGRYGAFLLSREHWSTVCDVVRAMRAAVSVPVSVKIRLLPTIEETLELCRLLQGAGACMLVVHARQRCAPEQRMRRSGPAQLEAVRAIKDALQIPVVSNGNVSTRLSAADLLSNLQATRADGLMLGEPLLSSPALFDLIGGAALQLGVPEDKAEAATQRRRVALELVDEFLVLAAAHPPPELAGGFDAVRRHVSSLMGREGRGSTLKFRLCPRAMDAKKVRDDLLAAQSTGTLREVAHRVLLHPLPSER